MRNLLIILIVLLMTSCVTQKRCNSKFPPQVIRKDSIVYRDKEKIVRHDSIVYREVPKYYKKDSIVYRDKEGNITKDKLTIKGKYSTATAWINGFNLFGSIEEGTGDALAFTLTNTTIERDSWKEKYESVKETRTIKENTKFASFAVAFFWSVIALIVLGGIFTFLFIKFK
jgi:hypothetical protein